MLGRGWAGKKRKNDEPEKPFWISFADLMTGIMIIFLVTMAINIVNQRECPTCKTCQTCPTPTPCPACPKPEVAAITVPAILACAKQLEGKIDKRQFPDVVIGMDTVYFGSAAQFEHGKHCLDRSQRMKIREIMKIILEQSEEFHCKDKIKKYLIEGYTDTSGSYLANLILSQQRSTSVMLALLEPNTTFSLAPGQRAEVGRKFVVDGYSYQSTKRTAEESRRVEMRLSFLEPNVKNHGIDGSFEDISKGWDVSMERLKCPK